MRFQSFSNRTRNLHSELSYLSVLVEIRSRKASNKGRALSPPSQILSSSPFQRYVDRGFGWNLHLQDLPIEIRESLSLFSMVSLVKRIENVAHFDFGLLVV